MNNLVKRTGNRGYENAVVNRPIGSLVGSLLGNDMARLLDDELWGLSNRVTPHTVPVNIRETDKAYEVDVMAPGLKKNDFKIALDGKQLAISFEHKEEYKEGGDGTNYLRQEYRHQSFTRNFMLDDTVNANAIAASYVDGVLHVIVPKKEEAQRVVRNVDVQ